MQTKKEGVWPRFSIQSDWIESEKIMTLVITQMTRLQFSVYYKRDSGLTHDPVRASDKLNNNIVAANRFWKSYPTGDILRVITVIGWRHG